MAKKTGEPTLPAYYYKSTLIPMEAADHVGVSYPKMLEWLRSKKCPFGDLIENVHFFKNGSDFVIIKRQLDILFGITPPSADCQLEFRKF